MKFFTTEQNRINWVDYYKAFSIFLIVIGHSILQHAQLIHLLFLFHVPLFFFISGYLEKTESCNTQKYLSKIFYALVIPYFLWNILCVVFHLPITIKNVCAVLVGISLWNAASWFLSVLIIIKLVALMLRNHKFILATFSTTILLALFLLNKRMPFYANLAFMFIPFYFLGMYGKNIINKIAINFTNKAFINIFLLGIATALLLACYKFTDVPHTYSVTSFTDKFYHYWLTGLLGIISMFFLCICFNKNPCGVIQAISISTLFIMCSHFEIIYRATGYITNYYGDIYSILFVVLYFLLQCACIPIVLKYFPVLAGRKAK